MRTRKVTTWRALQCLIGAQVLIPDEQANGSVKLNSETEQGNGSVKLNSETEQGNVSVKLNSESEQANGSVKLNSETEQGNGSVKLNSETEQANGSVKLNSSAELAGVPSMQADFVTRYYEEVETKSRDRVEDTHKRDTFLIHKDLLERLNELAEIERKRGNKGFKKRLINYLLERELPSLETKIKGSSGLS